MDQDSRRRLLHSGLVAPGVRAAPARACESLTQTLRIVPPWTRATAPDAGLAVPCTTFTDAVEDDRLVDVETPVAGATGSRWAAPTRSRRHPSPPGVHG